jgi:single-strand DNA-binding protein
MLREGESMNSLNSILLEGNLTDGPISTHSSEKTPICRFTVESYRYYKAGDVFEKEVSRFEVETWAGLAQKCTLELAEGRGVRVVGRLKQYQDGIKIIAEHVEFKPVKEMPPEIEYAEQLKNSGLTPS